MTKNTSISILIGAVTATLLIIMFWLILTPSQPPANPDTVYVADSSVQQMMRITERAKALAAYMEDSVKALNAEKNAIQIELDNSKAKIKEYVKQINAFKQYPKQGETTIWSKEINDKVHACDSLADQLRETHFALEEQRNNIIDSLNAFYSEIIDAKDDIITDQERYAGIQLKDLTRCRQLSAMQSQEFEKAKKQKKAGWLAAAAGAVLVVLTNL